MTNVFKYIIIAGNDGIDYPIIFSKLIQHVKIAARLCGPDEKVIGAGFLSISSEECIPKDNYENDKDTSEVIYFCYGESVSLKVKSRGDIDRETISKDYERFG